MHGLWRHNAVLLLNCCCSCGCNLLLSYYLEGLHHWDVAQFLCNWQGSLAILNKQISMSLANSKKGDYILHWLKKPTYIWDSVWWGIILQEEVNNLRMALLSCLMQWGIAQFILNIHPDTLLQQEADHSNWSKMAGHMKRGITSLGFSILFSSIAGQNSCRQK